MFLAKNKKFGNFRFLTIRGDQGKKSKILKKKIFLILLQNKNGRSEKPNAKNRIQFALSQLEIEPFKIRGIERFTLYILSQRIEHHLVSQKSRYCSVNFFIPLNKECCCFVFPIRNFPTTKYDQNQCREITILNFDPSISIKTKKFPTVNV